MIGCCRSHTRREIRSSRDFRHIRGRWRDSGFRLGGTDLLGIGFEPLLGLGDEPLRGLGFGPMDAPSDAVEDVPKWPAPAANGAG